MQFADLLNQIRHESIRHIIQPQIDGAKDILISERQLEDFFNQISDALTVNDPSKIIPSLNDSFSSRGEDDRVSLGIYLFSIVFFVIQQKATELLSGERAEEFIEALQSIFVYGNQYIYRLELDRSISDAVKKLNDEQYSLTRLEKSKSDFISIAAHELRTPLTLIEGYSAMLREIIEQKKIFDDHIIQLINGMDSGSRRLREIINDMIDVSLIDNEMLSLNYQPVWINKLLNRLQVAVEPIIQTRQLTLDVHRFKNDDKMFFADGERIFQALYNVISNAIKFTPDGGKIVVDGKSYDEFLELIIIDNGVGINPEKQKEIFNKFQPVSDSALHTSGKQKFMGGGPGLGLPIAKGIIEAHGGRIWVESDGYDEVQCPGSTFSILLPMRHQLPENWTANLFEPMKGYNSNRDSQEL
jgi:signal transduction histidine kinase